MAFPHPQQRLMWQIDLILNQGKVTDSVMDQMAKCNLDVDHNRSSYSVMQAFAHVIQSVMNNYTYVSKVTNGKLCESGNWALKPSSYTAYNSVPLWKLMNLQIRISSKVYSGRIPYQFPLVTENKVNSLKFVACGGNVAMNSLSFREFVSGFDLYIWFSTLMSVVVVSTMLWISELMNKVRKPGPGYVECLI